MNIHQCYKSQQLACIMSQFIPVYSLNTYVSIHFLISNIYLFIFSHLFVIYLIMLPVLQTIQHQRTSWQWIKNWKESWNKQVGKFKVQYWHLSGGTEVNHRLQSRLKPGMFWIPVRSMDTSANFLSLIFTILQVLHLNLVCTHFNPEDRNSKFLQNVRNTAHWQLVQHPPTSPPLIKSAFCSLLWV